MRYRQSNQPPRGRDQQARELIRSNDVLSTQEQEEVIAYLARSLRTSTQFLKVVVGLHVLVALVYVFLLLSGSPMFDLAMDETTTKQLHEVAQQQQQQPMGTTMATTTTTPPEALTSSPPTGTQDPLVLLAALDVKQQKANRKYAQDYLERRDGGFSRASMTVMSVLSMVMVLYSVGLLLWAAWSGYAACRMLRVNVEDLTSTAPLEAGTALHALQVHRTNGSLAAHTPPQSDTHKQVGGAHSLRAKLQTLQRRAQADPPAAQYAMAAFASLASCFWLCGLLRRQRMMQRAYAAVGLPSPSVFSGRTVTDALLEYVLAVWQPLFHLAIGRLLRSMLDTKENLVALSKMKYRFDRV
jgi:hypothetical protein